MTSVESNKLSHFDPSITSKVSCKMSRWTLDVENPWKPEPRVFNLPNRVLASAGPTNCSPRVIQALTSHGTTPVCAEMYKMMDDVRELLKYVFQTESNATFGMQNSGTGALEATLFNLLEPGEKVIIAIGGIWADRTVESAVARGLDVITLRAGPGDIFATEELEQAVIKHKPSLLFVTHGESSNGTLQPLEELGKICHKHNCLLAVDAIVSLGGVPYFQDRWEIDVGISASQKGLGAPVGFAFVSLSSRALERLDKVKTPSPFYLSFERSMMMWGCIDKLRKFHYSYSSQMMAAVREALAEIAEEGLENVWMRHRRTSLQFCQGLEKLGLTNFVPKPENRLWTVTLFCIPPRVNYPVLMKRLGEKHNVVIGFGIGPSTGKAMRVGIMAYNARPEVVEYILGALDESVKYCLSDEGQKEEAFKAVVV